MAANRQFERETRVLDARQQAGAELVTQVWRLAAHSIDVVPKGGEFADLEPSETAAIYGAYSVAAMVLGADGRDAAKALFEALERWVGDFSAEMWEAMAEAEHVLIAVINGESAPVRGGDTGP